MKHVTWILLVLATALDSPAADELRLVEGEKVTGFVWPNTPPKDCPFKQSSVFTGVYFTGKHSNYQCGDTWYPSWAGNDNLYSPYTDGSTVGVSSASFSINGRPATTGHAVMIGDDPVNLELQVPSPPYPGNPAPYKGRYPCGSLVHEGIWYYGTYCLGPEPQVVHGDIDFNWPVLGPMPGFRISRDYGKTWTPSPHTPESPLFPEPETFLGPVKMGAPHFVDFGRNMEHSPDGKAYLLGMGAEKDDPGPRFANLSWISADQAYLARVTPSPETINDLSAYEFYAGRDEAGDPVWTDDFSRIEPLLEWNNHMGCVTATYNAPLDKYLMCVTDGWPTVGYMNSYILEASRITGPWRLVTYMRHFGEQAYFLNFPSKFISEDGLTLWLCYSANFSPTWRGHRLEFNPPGGRYGLCLHEMELLPPERKPVRIEPAVHPVQTSANLARKASVSVSSLAPGYIEAGATDGCIQGYPSGDIEREWASNGETAGAWVRLDWPEPVTISRIWLFDRPNTYDQVTSAEVQFSGNVVHPVTMPLPDGAEQGVELQFEPRTVDSLTITITSVKEGTRNAGLSEIAVFEALPLSKASGN